MGASIETATVIRDEAKFDSLGGDSQPVEIHYQFITPFQKASHQSQDEELDENDVVIEGPVYVGNDAMLDRHGELVDVNAIMGAWDGYAKNPVILFNHSKTYGVIGKMTEVKLGGWDGLDGEVPIGRAVIDGGEDDITRKIRKGMLKAFSIGFIAKAAVKECMDGDEESCYIRFTEIEWVETSVVDVPASPDALFAVEKRVIWGPNKDDKSCDCVSCDCKSVDSKEVVGVDLFTTEEEALARAEELGCEGKHTHYGDDGEELFMPCESMEAYESVIGDGDDELFSLEQIQDASNKLHELSGIIDGLAITTDRLLDKNSVKEQMADNQEPLIKTDLLNSPVTEGVNSEGTEMTDEEITVATEEVALIESDTPVEPPVEIKQVEEVEQVEEPVIEEPITEEPITEEPVIEQVTEVAEELSIEMPKPAEVLLEVVKALSFLDATVTDMKVTLDKVAELQNQINDLESKLSEVTEEKAVAEREAEIDAEVAKRVASVIGEATATEPAVAERKSVTAESPAPTGVTRFDPQPEVSKGMNGLATWLENQITTRGE